MANYDHIFWKPIAKTAKNRPNEGFGRKRTPLRQDPVAHAKRLVAESKTIFEEGSKQRIDAGIDPSFFRVIQLTFLEENEREQLTRLGIKVIEEQELRLPFGSTYYVVRLQFEAESLTKYFLQTMNAQKYSVIEFEKQRASNGDIDTRLLSIRFADLDSAKLFFSDESLRMVYKYKLLDPRPVKKSFETKYRLTVQFADTEAIKLFQEEMLSYRNTSPISGILSNNIRSLFDALDSFELLQPDDRKGYRLTNENPPEGEFYIDVDLWHPGDGRLVSECIRQFRQLVESNMGVVTDGPTSVAEMLFLARVKGTSSTLEKLLTYDRVARVDLPPQIPNPPVSIFELQEPPNVIAIETITAPLACVIDSGVVSSHPLLSGSIVDEYDFDSGENTHVDKVGHGTRVAGILVYGDVNECLSSGHWEAKVRILSAKVMRKSNLGDFSEFADEKRAETQIIEAIKHYNDSYKCRVFNLSIGSTLFKYNGGRQLPLAILLDELVRQRNIVVVVSAGNVASPDIPNTFNEELFKRSVRDQLFSSSHALIDPATAVNVLTVGSIARTEQSRESLMYPGRRLPIIAAPRDCPSPFTRTGLCDSIGSGLRKTIKPELVAYGGNFCLGSPSSRWKEDLLLGEPSLRFDYQGSRLLNTSCGTSFAAPYVSHVCALIEERLKELYGRSKIPSANLIRALTVHSAELQPKTKEWLSEGYRDAEARTRIFRAVGYGKPRIEKALFSTDNHVVLLSEDTLREDTFHVYELELPNDFVKTKGRRTIRVTLAFDPPVVGTRKDYLARTMWFQVFRDYESSAVYESMSDYGKTNKIPRLKSKDFVPTYTALQWSTVQSAHLTSTSPKTFSNQDGVQGSWHILVACDSRIPTNASPEQGYALVVSLEHSDARVKIHQVVRKKLVLLQRLRT
jgi:subtilisin family serine protease